MRILYAKRPLLAERLHYLILTHSKNASTDFRDLWMICDELSKGRCRRGSCRLHMKLSWLSSVPSLIGWTVLPAARATLAPAASRALQVPSRSWQQHRTWRSGHRLVDPCRDRVVSTTSTALFSSPSANAGISSPVLPLLPLDLAHSSMRHARRRSWSIAELSQPMIPDPSSKWVDYIREAPRIAWTTIIKHQGKTITLLLIAFLSLALLYYVRTVSMYLRIEKHSLTPDLIAASTTRTRFRVTGTWTGSSDCQVDRTICQPTFPDTRIKWQCQSLQTPRQCGHPWIPIASTHQLE